MKKKNQKCSFLLNGPAFTRPLDGLAMSGGFFYFFLQLPKGKYEKIWSPFICF